MPNDIASDLDVECNVVGEYGLAMAIVAERMLKYPDRLRLARSEDERAFIRKEHSALLNGFIRTNRIAVAALEKQNKKGEITMPSWLKHVGMAIAGVACIGVSVFFPPAAPVLGPIGTKLAIAGGGTILLAAASPDHIKTAVNLITGKK